MAVKLYTYIREPLLGVDDMNCAERCCCCCVFRWELRVSWRHCGWCHWRHCCHALLTSSTDWTVMAFCHQILNPPAESVAFHTHTRACTLNWHCIGHLAEMRMIRWMCDVCQNSNTDVCCDIKGWTVLTLN